MSPQTSMYRDSERRWTAQVMVCLVSGLLLMPTGSGADLKPPKPDPANPINYILWINETMGGGIKENAAGLYKQAYESLTPFDGDWDDVLAGPWSGNRKMSNWLTANTKALAEFRKAAAMPDCFFTIPDREPTGDPRRDHLVALCMLPNLTEHRNLARALIAEGYMAWQQGDHKVLTVNAILVLRSAQHLDNTPILIQRLMSTAITEMAYKALIKAMSLSEKPDALLKWIFDGLRASEHKRPPFIQACLTNRLTAWDYAQRVFIPGTQSGMWTVYEPLNDTLLTPEHKSAMNENEWKKLSKELKSLDKIGFDATLREMNAYYDEFERWAAKPYPVAAGEARGDKVSGRFS